MKIGIIGANGQLGTDLVRVFADHEVLAWTRSDFDIRDPRLATHVITQARPDVVINTAAFHKTDECEDDVETAFSVNAIGARTVARAGAACDAPPASTAIMIAVANARIILTPAPAGPDCANIAS